MSRKRSGVEPAINGVFPGRLAIEETRSIDRSGWHFQHVTAPRPSCLERVRIREFLRNLMPGQSSSYHRVRVQRHTEGVVHKRIRYRIEMTEYLTFAQAVAELEARLLHQPTTKGS